MAMRGMKPLKRLRALIKSQPENLSAYIVNHNDAHLSEYIASKDARLEFISGFSGSAGMAIITEDHAALWTDGRYHIQAENELRCHSVTHGQKPWTLMKEGLPSCLEPHVWLSKVIPAKGKVGVDPQLISYVDFEKLAKQLDSEGHKLEPITPNLIDQVWDERPVHPETLIEILPLSLTGRSWQDKLTDLRSDMKTKNAQALILTALDEIAWLFNLRGSDIEFNPVFYSYAVVTPKSAHLFVDENKITDRLGQYLTSPAGGKFADRRAESGSMTNGGEMDPAGLQQIVDIQPYWMFKDFLANVAQRPGRVWVSPRSPYNVVSAIPSERRVLEVSPIQLRKAIKNETEIEGMKKAHIRDAVAMCEFLSWLEAEVPKGQVTEISAADKLAKFRRVQTDFVGLSFETCSASGPNSAIVHYKPKTDTDRAITVDELYLVDSGGQYRDGTTDITRTVHFGTPTNKQREYFTRVVKSVILLTTAKFPRLIKGVMLDSFARKNLWDVGLDYMHGTGHGVGAYLNVHEGPFSISFRENPLDCGLREGMFTSIEPGYYKEDEFGIRIENVALIIPATTDYERPFLTFETVTLVPIQRKLLEPSILTKEEIEWLNTYNQQCRDVVGPQLKNSGREGALEWLLRETEPIGV